MKRIARNFVGSIFLMVGVVLCIVTSTWEEMPHRTDLWTEDWDVDHEREECEPL